ncbi:MAG: sigma-54-dependent Fis family transcriptional regulator [Myxococcales bacterium]|nr:MAG: sigma-54-dependent Fis family transcriptional regulator [Myxococcales bacterium]
MDHQEIRAIRGPLSRAAFARVLGVTSLTVLRWELPDDNKEARRPRARTVEALQRLKDEGHDALLAASHGAAEEEEAPEDALEAGSPPLPSSPELAQDSALVEPLLARLMGEGWPRAEDELLGLLASKRLRSAPGRTLATLGLLQVQLLARLDVRGGLLTLTPILDDLERGAAPREVAARAHLLAALLFGLADSRFFDVGRVNAHAAEADALLAPEQTDLRVLLATARVASTRFMGSSVAQRAYESNVESLNRAEAALPRLLAENLHGLHAECRGDEAAVQRHRDESLTLAERLEFGPFVLALLADRAWRAVNGASVPQEVLELTQAARKRAAAMDLVPAEAMVRILACEVEALTRLARFQEADEVVAEANALAKRAGVPRYALAMPIARLYVFTNRVQLLAPWADSLEAETVSSPRPLGNVHALAVRGMSATFEGDTDRASELLSRVLGAPEPTVGLPFLVHHAHFEHALARLLSKDLEGCSASMARARKYILQHPSAWHSAAYLRMESFLALARGQLAQARQKAEATLGTFQLLGDSVQVALAQVNVALVARSEGAPEAENRLADALTELKRLGVWSPQLMQRAQVLSRPAPADQWQEETLLQRLVGALDRLSVRGLSHEQHRRSLATILGELFPGREAMVGGREAPDDEPGVVVVPDSKDGVLRFGVRGPVGSDELAALKILAAFVSRLLGDTASPEPEAIADNVLPHFIAAAPATRKLKADIARLSRSSATILIGGESGTGKEVVARAVHDLSTRADRPYIVFNCASVPRDLFESQLFGHRKGSFTGAHADSPGVISAAHGGTLFLDEIGELPLDTQPKLLRFLENAEVTALGEQRPRRVDVRVLAATHRDLGRLMRDGRFREDLYYRLNVVPLHVPPLRERPEDVVALARLFIARLAPEPGRAPELATDALHALRRYAWPGNVRELRNVIERAMAYAPVPAVLQVEHLRLPS